jgi:cytochrome P450
MTKTYGKTFRHNGMVATCDPGLVRALLMDRAHAERRPPVHRLMARMPGADGVLFMEGEPWLRRTRAVMSVFHQGMVDSWAPTLHDMTLAAAEQWRRQPRQIDLSDAVQQVGVCAVLKMGFGVDPDDPRGAALGRALVEYKQFTMVPGRRRLDEFGLPPSKLLALPQIVGLLIGMRRRMRAVERAVRELTADARGRHGKPDWVTALAAAGLSDTELAEEVNHLYGAYNAIDYIVTAALYELARRPELTSELRSELLSVLGADAVPAREQVAQLPLTGAFMKEILRCYPVTMGAVRVTGTEIDDGGERIPANTQVMILLQALHHHPDFWDAPADFRPARWLESPTPRVPYSYVPFLDGSRKCIGRHMAEMQLLVMLSALVRRFDVHVFGDPVVPPFIIPRFNRPFPFTVAAASSSLRVS